MKKIAIIGSGIGGLIAGNLLAKKGHQVTIFEAHSSPGGYTAGFWRNGFYFESGTFSFEASEIVFKVMEKIGVRDKIAFIRQKTRMKADRFDAAPETYAEFKEMLYQAYPEEKERQDRFFKEVDKLVAATRPFMARSSLWAKTAAGLQLPLLYKKYMHLSMSQFVGKYFEKDSRLYRHWIGMVYPEMSALMIGGAMVSFIEDYWTVKGGMQSWADVLADNFKKLGGEIKLNTYIDKIITTRGKATGVASGKEHFAADEVISACDYKQTFLKLLDDQSLLTTRQSRKIERAAVSESFVMVYLGLKISNEQLLKIMQVPHLSFFDEKPGLDITDDADDKFFEKNSICLYSPSLLDPKLSPAGKSMLMIAAMAPPDWMENWGCGDQQKYRVLKEMAKKAMISKAEKIIPGLRGMIEYEDAATPLTYERFTHNTCGATSAWSWNPEKKFYPNIMGTKIGTPVANLYIGSCWACQMGGIPGAISAAIKCANKIG
jgi:phytoene dehydrogenase-like protein